MADTWYDDWWTGLKSCIQTAWTDVSFLWIETSVERRNWSDLITAKNLTGPWAVVSVDIAPSDDWGVGGPRFSVAATCYYIAPISLGTSDTPITNLIMARLLALQAGLYASGLGTVLTEMPIDIGADNPVNKSMLDGGKAFQAGSIQATSIVVVVNQ